MKNIYLPEGCLLKTPENQEYISSISGLERAFVEGKILESTVSFCDSSLRLHVDLNGILGIMDKEETVFCREGEHTKDIAIITRVGKPIAFKVIGFRRENGVIAAVLSRRKAQEECQNAYLDSIRIGDIIRARVTHLENFGAFVDVGCGLSSLLTVDSISVSRISHPRDRLCVGEEIFVVIKNRDEQNGRLYVSMKELLGTWEENASEFEVGQTVLGIVRSIEDYGVFIELAPNLAGLAEIRADTRDLEIAKIGAYTAVYIKSILPDRMKIKLVLIDSYRGIPQQMKHKYFIDCENTKHLSRWIYSPATSNKTVETVFDEI
ncbi:MAG: 30S ribosomal protein S1 [Ruminococcaceae bacterium]|nr:30S ribosomal protein S1 [Oscillospiraceae bacterium]